MSTFSFVQVTDFRPDCPGWNLIGNITSWEQDSDTTILLSSEGNPKIKIYFLSPTAVRVRFNPYPNFVYDSNAKKGKYDGSYAVVNYSLGDVTLNIAELDGKGPDYDGEPIYDGKTLLVETDVLKVYIGFQPYGIAIYKKDKTDSTKLQSINKDNLANNLKYLPSTDNYPTPWVANIKAAPSNELYFGFGEKAGRQLNKKSFNLTFFNYDNFTYNDQTYDGQMIVPGGVNDGGPLNPSGPLYNSMPFLLAVGLQNGDITQPAVQYSYGIFLDNVSQTYFNMGSTPDPNNQYMQDKYYFGALSGELDYYIMVGNESNNSANVIADVLNQYTVLTGRAAMPPKYALGYHQGCYGYYDRWRLMEAAYNFRNNRIPIDGLHIDVDFQDNYRTFTISERKFPDAKGMFDELHAMGFKCSTNITGIISGNPYDENGSKDTPYKTRDHVLNLNKDDCTLSTYVENPEARPFIYNTRYPGEELSPDFFLANEGYGTNNGVNINPYPYPTPDNTDGNNVNLGTYGFYCDMAQDDVQKWWGEQYDHLLKQGLDMIWQDMTDPAVIPNRDNDCEDKTLPLDLMMYDKVTGKYQPNAAVHNAFALNLVQSTYNGITALKSGDTYTNLYNYKKRNFIIARGGYAGLHRYAGIWTGDSASSWDFLAINIPEVLNVGMSGQPISGCDIGGFANGPGSICPYPNGNGPNPGARYITDPELLTRWMNLGAFLPWFRNHYDGYTKSFQEPYAYGEPVLSNCRKYIEIRYKLIQLFYDAMYECTQTGMPIARAMFLNDLDDYNVFRTESFDSNQQQHLDQQFFVGKDLLVAPMVDPGTQRYVYLPKNYNWYVFDGQEGPLEAPTEGGKTYAWGVDLNRVPMYVREGAILPMRQLEQYIGELNAKGQMNPITFNIYPGMDSSYQLYQDDEVSTAFQETNAYRLTQISTTSANGSRSINFNRTHDNYPPKEDHFFISFLGYKGSPSSVKAADIALPSVASAGALQDSGNNAFFYDDVNQKVVIKIFDNEPTLTVEMDGAAVAPVA